MVVVDVGGCAVVVVDGGCAVVVVVVVVVEGGIAVVVVVDVGAAVPVDEEDVGAAVGEPEDEAKVEPSVPHFTLEKVTVAEGLVVIKVCADPLVVEHDPLAAPGVDAEASAGSIESSHNMLEVVSAHKLITSTMPRSNDSPIACNPPLGVKSSVSPKTCFASMQKSSVIES